MPEQFKLFPEDPNPKNISPDPEEEKLTFEEHLSKLDSTTAPGNISYTDMWNALLPKFQIGIKQLTRTKAIGGAIRGSYDETIRLNDKGISNEPSNRSRSEHVSTPRAIKNITSGPDNLSRAAGDDTHKD